MSGCYRGAKTIMQDKYPLAIYVQCKADVLNLALVHSSNQSNVTDMFEIVQQIAVYIGASAKRLEIFQEIDQGRSLIAGLDYWTAIKHSHVNNY